jgi:hypothetical protein
VTVYVDPLMNHGWILRGREISSCHMFTDEVDLAQLHRLADMIGCKREWFQDRSAPHYDLTVMRRQEAIGCGAIAVTRREAVEIWRARRARVDAATAAVIAARLQGTTCKE